MRKTASVQKMTSAALLIALGIIIPMFMPVKVVTPITSYTLASHVPLFLSMFISPLVAAAVAAGTTLGFALNPIFPPVVVLRAASHIIFALLGAWYLKKQPKTPLRTVPALGFSSVIALIHAACEVCVSVFFFMFGGGYSDELLGSLLLLVGVFGVVHSVVEFAVSLLVFRILVLQRPLRALFPAAAFVKAAGQ